MLGIRSLSRSLRPNVSQVRNMAASAEQADVIVLGGGPGGYVAAIKAGQLGMKVQTRVTSFMSLVPRLHASRSVAPWEEPA